jgi:thiol-disulfide isomerase/thioredoxin
MSPRARRIAVAAGAIVAVQAALAAVYLAVERNRGAPVSHFSFERLAGTESAPALRLEARDGTVRAWRPGRPTLVHFWATWCAPCQEELPALLAAARAVSGESSFDLVAVSVDDSWPVIDSFFDGQVPSEIARDPGAASRFGVGPLPDSFFVSADGRLVARYRGARDWQAAAARAHLVELARSPAR